jgi:hypothetical protein
MYIYISIVVLIGARTGSSIIPGDVNFAPAELWNPYRKLGHINDICNSTCYMQQSNWMSYKLNTRN